MRWTIERLKNARESEDKVEFKRAEGGNFAYDLGLAEFNRRHVAGNVQKTAPNGG